VLVREVVRVAAVHLANCGVGTAVRGINRGRSEVVALVREVMSVTAVHPASCGEGYGRGRRKSWPVKAQPK
jgi:hypothetical protein